MGQTCEDAFALYLRCISSGVVDYLQQQARIKIRQSIYTAHAARWRDVWRRCWPERPIRC
jgi:hypothetical protein